MTDQTKSTARVQTIVDDYLNRSGMSPVDFARRIGYSDNTLAQYRNGHYSGITSPDRIEAAILAFVRDNPVESDTFSGTIYETETVRAMRRVFAKLLERPQVYMVYAPPGSGKTDVARKLISEHNAQHSADQKTYIFRVYCRARICPRDLMKRVATACGSQSNTAIDRAIQNLRWDFRGCRVLLYLDEAQHLSIECFETLRELLDEDPRFSLCFAGSHELDRIFAQFAGTLEQLERRITDKVTLPAVTEEEATGILRSELGGLALDASLIRQQIQLATITVRVNRKNQRYISIGRLMAAISEIREGIGAAVDSAEKVEAIA
jgi:DNA transposition AAA+ family ATPase